jgi:hypothetical protein
MLSVQVRDHVVLAGYVIPDRCIWNNNNTETGLKGFEPLTYGLRVRRSTELSYKPMPDWPIFMILNEV